MSTRCRKRRAIVVEICPGINWPESDIKRKSQRSPKNFRFNKLAARHSRFPAGCLLAFPGEVKSNANGMIDENKRQEGKYESANNRAKAGITGHRICTPVKFASWLASAARAQDRQAPFYMPPIPSNMLKMVVFMNTESLVWIPVDFVMTKQSAQRDDIPDARTGADTRA